MKSKKGEEHKVLDIDQNNLDEEWTNQPKLFGYHARQLAQARKEHAEAKANIDVVRAELDSQIRESPSEFGLEKITEDAIRSVIQGTEEYKEAKQTEIDAKFEMDMIDALVTALEHRKYALQDLVKLWLADYFSEPQADRDTNSKLNGKMESKVMKRGRKSFSRKGE